MKIDFDKIGLLILQNNRILLCRKKYYTSKLILPGGQIEDGEDDIQCLRREIKEELDNNEIITTPIYIGVYIDKAAADDPKENKIVRIKLYQGKIKHQARPTSELKELVWFGQDDNWDDLSLIIKNKIFLDLIKRNILKWNR